MLVLEKLFSNIRGIRSLYYLKICIKCMVITRQEGYLHFAFSKLVVNFTCVSDVLPRNPTPFDLFCK